MTGSESYLRLNIPDGEAVRQELAQRRGAEIQQREELARHQSTIEKLREELAAKSLRAAAEINRRDGRIEELQKAYAHLDGLLRNEQAQRNHLWGELERSLRECEKHELANRELKTTHQRELNQVRNRFLQTNELLQKVSVRLAKAESDNVSLVERLRKQLLEMKRLVRLLDQIDDAATLLRRSRRWKLANPFAALLATFSRKPLPGFGHLDKNVQKYRLWRTNHPEVETLAEEIQALRPREIITPSSAEKKTPAPALPQRPPRPEEPISFPQRAEVEVSIIIPVYNQVDFTLSCLASIQQNSDAISYEVIVVDDASTDSTREDIGRIPGLVYLRAETNSGFIASCNKGAAEARGHYLVFLNNDTTVTPGWLAALCDTFEFEPEAGLVGSKLVYPDGRLQEAGGIIWRDGSGWNRGKFQDASNPEYNYLREVAYCSAASLMIPKETFDRLGGFDPRFTPAYYEDTDLAFKVARLGRKVLYQPLSVVIHYEGVTSGTDISAGVKRYEKVNRQTFLDTWAGVLASLPENGDLESYYALKPGKKRILVIDHHLPMPDRDSGSLRMYNILCILQRIGHEVTFIPDNLAGVSPYGDNLRKRGIKLLHHPYIKSIRDYLRAEGTKFDVVILSRCDFAHKHLATVREHAPQSRLIFDTVDLHFLRAEREAEMTQDAEGRQRANEKRRLEFELIDQADQTWVVSPVERDLILASHPESSVEVVSNIVELPGSPTPFADRRDILFIGSFQHPPNTDAVLFFTQEILPLVREQLPDLRFYIIGDKAPPEIIALANEQTIVTGYQPNVSIFFNAVKLSVAPIRYGAGVKGKINQSMGFGVPVVATVTAAEGMNLRTGEDVMIADDPAQFTDAVVKLYCDEELWNRISQNGIDKTLECYSATSAKERLEHLLADPI